MGCLHERPECRGVDRPPYHVAAVSDQPGSDGVEALCLNLHGMSVECRISCASLLAHCRSLFRRHESPCHRRHGVVLQLDVVDAAPRCLAPPDSIVVLDQPPRLVGRADQHRLFLDLRGKGALVVDRSQRSITGQVTPELLEDRNLLDRLLVGSLALLLREWGFFPVHGFAAARDDQAALLAGESGSGKTTAGLALVRSGWGFLANDLCLLREMDRKLHALSCPERVHITPETASLLPELQALAAIEEGKSGFHVEDVYPNAPIDQAVVKWLLFPRIRPGQPTRMHPMTATEALLALLPHSMATWDRSSASAHFSLLERLAKTTPAYQLDLGTDFEGWGSLLADLPPAAP